MIVDHEFTPKRHGSSTDDPPDLSHRPTGSADAQLRSISRGNSPVEDSIHQLIVVGRLDDRLDILVVEHPTTLPNQISKMFFTKVIWLFRSEKTVVRTEVVGLLL